MSILRARAADERGSAAVEFALVLVPISVLLFGIISYGILLSFRESLTTAASEGVRAAAVAPASTTDADRSIRALEAINRSLGFGIDCDSAGMDCDITFDRTGSCGQFGCTFVTLTYAYDDNPLGPRFPGIPLPNQLQYTTAAELS